MGHQAGDMLASYVGRYLHYRRKRDLMDQTEPKTSNFANFRIRREAADDELKHPEMPEGYKHAFHGGERCVEFSRKDFLNKFSNFQSYALWCAGRLFGHFRIEWKSLFVEDDLRDTLERCEPLWCSGGDGKAVFDVSF